MNKLYFFMLLGMFSANAQQIDFPDSAFKAKLLMSHPSNAIAKNQAGNSIAIDVNQNGEIEVSEAQLVYELNVDNSSIVYFDGIQHFTNVRVLRCFHNQTQNLDIQQLGNLEVLECQGNQLTGLMIDNLSQMRYLDCSFNVISSLNVSGFENLEFLNCSGNNLSFLSVTYRNALTQLLCYDNFNLTSLWIDNCAALEDIQCYGSAISMLNVTNCDNLASLKCFDNQLATLDVTNLPNLEYLDCRQNDLTDLNVAGMQNLTWLECGNNLITELDLSGLVSLSTLTCTNTPLLHLDASECVALDNLECYGNPQLQTINIKNGKTEAIEFGNNPSLQSICADDWQIPAIQLAAIDNGYANLSVNSGCSLSTEQNFHAGIFIYPNPAHDYLNLSNAGSAIHAVTIYNMLGQKIKTQSGDGNMIGLEDIAPGSYILKVDALNASTILKFIKK